MSSVREDFDNYSYMGYVVESRKKLGWSGNQLMFTAEKMLILCDQGLNTYDDAKEFSQLIAACTTTPGLYTRTPIGEWASTDQEEWDDIVAIAGVSPRHARDIVEFLHGSLYTPFRRLPWLKFHNCYSSTAAPPWSAWFGRSPAVMCHLKSCAGLRPSFFERMVWGLSIGLTGLLSPMAEDTWRFSYHLVRKAPGGWWGRWCTSVWTRRLLKHWPMGMPQVRGAYFSDYGHPLAVWMLEARNLARSPLWISLTSGSPSPSASSTSS